MLRRPLVLLLLAAFLPLAALSVALGVTALQGERDKIERDALDRVRLMSGSLARDLTAQLDVLRVLAQSRDFDGEVAKADFFEIGQRIKQEMPAWLAMRLSRPDATVVADASLGSAPEPANPGRIVDIDSHRVAVETRLPVIGRVLRGPLGNTAFALRAPVIRDGSVKYVLSAVISPAAIRDRFLLPHLPEQWIATVIDGAGNIAARSLGPATLIGEPASAMAREVRARGTEGIYSGLVLEGLPTISAFHRLPVGNWSVHIGVPRDVFMAPLQQSLWFVGAGLVATLLLAVTFLWLLLREIKLKRREEFGMEGLRRLEALGRMTGGVAHDFNNLLMIVQGGAEGIKRGAATPERRRSYEDAILAAVKRGQALTQQLLAFAQRSAHEPVSFRIQDRAPELTGLLTRSVRENVELRISIPSDTWPVKADPNALEVALINLAVNASDAMPEGGALSIRAFNAMLSKGRDFDTGLQGAFVAIEVQDSGTGISPQHIDRIFEPFFTTKPQGKGTGLGLSQVYGFAQQSGGTITVKGKPGQGSTFTLYLPRTLQPVAAQQPAAPRLVQTHGGRILLVEDNIAVADVTAAMLGDAGYDVTHSASASQALALLKTRRDFDLILSDIVMAEGISGLDLAHHVRAAWPDMPIVLMTGYSEALTGKELAELPVVYKPFTEQEILTALASARQSRGGETANGLLSR